jgi:hypothetical protein
MLKNFFRNVEEFGKYARICCKIFENLGKCERISKKCSRIWENLREFGRNLPFFTRNRLKCGKIVGICGKSGHFL